MFKPTKEQKKAINTAGNVLITAAAGSGKTAVLVERVIKMLTREENPLSVERLLIVTFTNAAAAEMRGRIERRLGEELKKNPADRNLRRQMLLLPSAQICTIDTFCINLVRENFEHFSLSPDFKIVTDNELYPLYDSAVREVLDYYYNNELSRLTDLLCAYGCGGNDARLIDAVYKIFGYSTSMPFPKRWLAACRAMYEDPDSTAESFWLPLAYQYGQEPRDSEEIKSELRFAAPTMLTLLEICERFSARLWELMREKNMLTFFNTEQLALELLCTPEGDGYKMTEKAEGLSADFDEILVDEYQDVNDLQDTLFYILSDCGKKLFAVGDAKQSIYGFRGANPENFVKKKESYLPYDEAGVEDSKKIVLAANFRSRKGICGFINYLFSLTMSKQFGGVDYDAEESLISLAEFPKTDAVQTQIELLDTSKCEESDSLCEAKHIAAYIRKTMKEKPFLRDGQGLRAAKYSDFAILMRSPAGHADVYVEQLRRAGIPVRFETGGFIESREVSWVLSLLRVINNPTHDVPLLSLMMSPMFGFSADDVANIRLHDRKGSLYAALLAAEGAGDERAKHFLCELRRFRHISVTMSVERLLSRLYDETALLDTVLALSDGERRKNNLLLLLSFAAEYAENGGSLSGFVAYIEKIGSTVRQPARGGSDAVTVMSFHGSKGLQFPIVLIAGCHTRFNKSDSTASLVMDRHLGVAFKTLDTKENTRVNTIARELIAAGVARRNMSEELRVMYVALTRAEERLVVLLTSKSHAKKAAAAAKAINAGEGEEYVKSAGYFYDWFMYALLLYSGCEGVRQQLSVSIDRERLIDPPDCNIAVSIGAPEECLPQIDKEKSGEESEITADILRRMEYEYPHKALSHAPAKVSVSEVVKSGSSAVDDFTARPAFMSRAGLTPAQRGTATHKFMQFADYSSAAEDLEGEIARLRTEEFITPAEAEAINRREVERFFGSDIYRRMSRAVLHREMRFITEVPLESIGLSGDEKTVMQGVIDCVIDEGDSLSVIDFKTDRVKSADELTDRYARQLDIYADACTRMFSLPVKDKLIYSFALGKVIKI